MTNHDIEKIITNDRFIENIIGTRPMTESLKNEIINRLRNLNDIHAGVIIARYANNMTLKAIGSIFDRSGEWARKQESKMLRKIRFGILL